MGNWERLFCPAREIDIPDLPFCRGGAIALDETITGMLPVDDKINRLDRTEAKTPHESREPAPLRLTEQFKLLLEKAAEIAKATDSEAILLLLSGTADWERLRKLAGDQRIIVASDTAQQLKGAEHSGFTPIALAMAEYATYDRLSQALLEAVANEMLSRNGRVVALYSAFETGSMDTLSVISHSDHLRNVNTQELRKLVTNVPSQILRHVVGLAVEIGREGREGRPVGTMFVIGTPRKILPHTTPLGFDPVRGYNRNERNMLDAKVREGLKEIAQMDGAFIVSPKGIVEASCRYISSPASDITLSKGLGSRHWAAAAITRITDAVAVTVSESDGMVRIFKNGEVLSRIESRSGRPVMWKEFDHRPIGGETRPRP